MRAEPRALAKQRARRVRVAPRRLQARPRAVHGGVPRVGRACAGEQLPRRVGAPRRGLHARARGEHRRRRAPRRGGRRLGAHEQRARGRPVTAPRGGRAGGSERVRAAGRQPQRGGRVHFCRCVVAAAAGKRHGGYVERDVTREATQRLVN